MLRPAESHGLNILSSSLEISGDPKISWEHDVFDNSVAHLNFTEKTDELIITSRYELEQFNLNPFDFVLEIYTNDLPFAYQDEDAINLQPFMQPQYPGDEAAVREWLRPFLDAEGRGKTLDFLRATNSAIAEQFSYGRREEAGTQSPAETLRLGSGTCRDFTLLLMEIARHMGLATRYVSGYLCSSAGDESAPLVADNSTHAWTEIYLPGAGWTGFDPTSGILAAGYHVRVAATRTPDQATPIFGSFLGEASLFAGMEVKINAVATELPAG